MEAPKVIDSVNIFKTVSEQFHLTTKVLKLTLATPPSEIFDIYAELDPVAQQDVLGRLRFYNSLCEKVIEENEKERTELTYAWYALARLKLRPPNDLFDRIDINDCIEIFDSSGIQIYRSFNFAKFTTYSLEEILIYPWYRLFMRDEKIMALMMGAMKQVLSGQYRSPISLRIPPHICEETISKEKWRTLVSLKLACPLYGKNDQISGFLATQSLERVFNQN